MEPRRLFDGCRRTGGPYHGTTNIRATAVLLREIIRRKYSPGLRPLASHCNVDDDDDM